MDRKSETALLRGDLARLAVENRKLCEMVSRLEAASSRRIAALETEMDRMRLEMAERDRRLAKYENAHAPSSTGLLYNERRATFRKKMAEDGDGDGPEQDGDGDDGTAEDGPSRRGPPVGHAGVSHTNSADRSVVLSVYRCGTCGRGHLRKLPPVVKTVCDFAGGNSMAVECMRT